MSVLGTTGPDPIGMILGSDFRRFESPTGIDGLAKVNGDRIDILAVYATDPGTGQFREFIDQCKREFETICVWDIWGDWLALVLQRYGFRFYREIQRGEELEGYRYDAGRGKRRPR